MIILFKILWCIKKKELGNRLSSLYLVLLYILEFYFLYFIFFSFWRHCTVYLTFWGFITEGITYDKYYFWIQNLYRCVTIKNADFANRTKYKVNKLRRVQQNILRSISLSWFCYLSFCISHLFQEMICVREGNVFLAEISNLKDDFRRYFLST